MIFGENEQSVFMSFRIYFGIYALKNTRMLKQVQHDNSFSIFYEQTFCEISRFASKIVSRNMQELVLLLKRIPATCRNTFYF